ncbi:MAG: glycosyltransferase family 2 protein [Thermoleophilia bacterium]|nr:glycosyltransferase family 2 protein [Thermoleophilia bacterium]
MTLSPSDQRLLRDVSPAAPNGDAATSRHGDPLSPDEALSDVSIIIVSHNCRDYLERTLRAVTGRAYEVVVVDNASSDGSVELVRAGFPDVRLLALETNRGFGAANNAAMHVAHGRYFLLLNPDAWPLDDAVERLAAFADEHPRSAVVGPRLVNEDFSPQRSVFGYPLRPLSLAAWTAFPHAVSGLYTASKRLRNGNGLSPPDPEGRTNGHGGAVAPSEFLSGAALLLRRDAVEAVGGFDERFFMYSEETDLIYRLRQAGWCVDFCSDAEFVHIGGASTRRVKSRMYREQLLSYLRFLAKHDGPTRAEQARRWLVHALRLRAVFAGDGQADMYRDSARWFASAPADELLRDSD